MNRLLLIVVCYFAWTNAFAPAQDGTREQDRTPSTSSATPSRDEARLRDQTVAAFRDQKRAQTTAETLLLPLGMLLSNP